MIQFSNLALRRGSRILFEQASFSLHQGQRVGITGANGCGKSSLFALLQDQLHSDEGELSLPPNIVIAHVAQETPATERSAIDYVLDGDKELRQIQQQLAVAEQQDDGQAQAECHHLLDTIDAYSSQSRAASLMQGLGFKPEQLNNPVTAFSGGWRMRLNLAQALMCRSDLLLLDEPTNHLDLDAVIWLESWLQQYQGTLLLISHDRDFLDKITTHIVHFEQQRLHLYTGNYSAFEKLRAEKLAQQQSLYEKQQREIDHIQDFIRRFKAKASKAKQAQGRMKALERMELIAQAHVDSPFSFHFFAPEKLPHPLMALEGISAGYDGNMILQGLNLSLSPGDRICLLGHNGAGKSTLIKVLAQELPPLEGKLEISSETRIGYFAQHQLEQLDPQASPLLHLQRLDPKATEQELRNYLGSFNFMGDRVFEAVAPFSGGEKARLVLALLIYQKPNLLLLDEPTNHLDLDMRHALSLALQDYTGAMVLVSHDRHLIRAVSDQLILVDQGRATPFDGDLDSYRQWLLQPVADNQKSANGANTQNKKAQRQQQAEQRKQMQPLQNKIRKLETLLDTLNPEYEKLQEQLAQADIYQPENKQQLQDLLLKQADIKKQLDETEDNWMSLSEELEQLKDSMNKVD